MEFSPEFTEFSPEVVKAAVVDGAAKIGGLLSRQEIETLDAISRSDMSRLEIQSAAPTLAGVIATVMSPDNIELGMGIKINRSTIYPKEVTKQAHLDVRSFDRGLSLLLPTRGDMAYFGASSSEFRLLNELGDTAAPELFWEYGPGDGILLRQKLTEINGQRLSLGSYDQVWHAGWAPRERSLRTIDFVTRRIKLPGELTLATGKRSLWSWLRVAN